MTYAFFEITHAAGVPHARHICEKNYKTDAQAIRAAEKINALRHTAIIKAFDLDGVKRVYELQDTDTGVEFVEVDETRQNSPYFKYLFA